jgi:erythronate-4-phosphate dehydrogenase
MAQLLGWNVIGYDPYVQLSHIENVSFHELLKRADAISIHVPLTLAGDYPTQHLFNDATFAAMKASAILINSARGPVIQQSALMDDIKKIIVKLSWMSLSLNQRFQRNCWIYWL